MRMFDGKSLGHGEQSPMAYTLFELAEAAGLSIEDILMIESRGVIKSCRLPNGRRIYADAEVKRLIEGQEK